MEANKILTADLIDILFEGRNQAYGAFELRKHYKFRLAKALGIVMGIIGCAFTLYLRIPKNVTQRFDYIIGDPELQAVVPDPPVVTPKPPLPQPPKKVMSIPFTSFRFTQDDVAASDKPPVQDLPDDATISVIGNATASNDGPIGPPLNSSGQGIVDAPEPAAKIDSIFMRVEVESTYPGGTSAWQRYLNKTFRYPAEAVDGMIQGTVEVQFIVDETGVVSHVEALSGPSSGGLRQEAERVILRSGRWEPAIQNGLHVKSYKRQPIVFRLE